MDKIVKSGSTELAILLEKLSRYQLECLILKLIQNTNRQIIGKIYQRRKDYRILNLNYFNDIGFLIQEMRLESLKEIVSKISIN